MNRKGFTLVELLMVVIIIGILVTLAVPNYYRSVERAKAGKAKATMDTIRKSELQYRAINDIYVDDLTLLTEYELPSNLSALSVADDGDWTYTVSGSDTISFILTAERLTGPHTGDTIIIDQDGVLTDGVGAGGHDEWGIGI
ncbi:MAG: prepilin-type N-terminal cleavage/methylation domain-containing protein [Candidatus Omnitrophica bacterium]|nr:prepilin-type N-terminal cleavage/methylation domain-containing protein [Candidatus Omnitrophota bacterium]MBU4479669.1 prepilin-type N-terminal cleavage/methylation domain-containing protein [Candidatus Omnitrophota bacterium]MCG2703651.1 prepilin-type N-terminal cleavage/methylation domain-containing protein [Candidatus Omnitrophota bacterium]